MGRFGLYLGLFCCLSAPTYELCGFLAGLDILSVIKSIFTLEKGHPVSWCHIFGNEFKFNDHHRSSMHFGCAQYQAACPKAFSSGKHFINLSTWYEILTS